MMAGALVLAMHDARRTVRHWRNRGVTVEQISAQLRCDHSWPAVERRIVDDLMLVPRPLCRITAQLDLFEPAARRLAA